MISETRIDFNCPFFDACELTKMESLCYKRISFQVCPEYQLKRGKIKQV
jgi:hypothetical protein